MTKCVGKPRVDFINGQLLWESFPYGLQQRCGILAFSPPGRWTAINDSPIASQCKVNQKWGQVVNTDRPSLDKSADKFFTCLSAPRKIIIYHLPTPRNWENIIIKIFSLPSLWNEIRIAYIAIFLYLHLVHLWRSSPWAVDNEIFSTKIFFFKTFCPTVLLFYPITAHLAKDCNMTIWVLLTFQLFKFLRKYAKVDVNQS